MTFVHVPSDRGASGEWHVVDLGNRGTAASVKTMDIVENLPPLGLPTE